MIKREKIYIILFGIYIFLSFYENYISGLYGISLTKYYISMFVILILAAYKSLEKNFLIIVFFIWFLIKFSSLLWVTSTDGFGSTVYSHWMSQVGYLLLLITVTRTLKENSTRNIIFFYYLTSLSMIFLSLFFNEPYQGTSRNVLTINGVQMDPNNMAAFYLPVLVISLHYINQRIKVPLNLLAFLLGLIQIMNTGSRSGLLASVIIILLYLFFNFSLKRIFSFIIVGSLISSAILVGISRFLSESIINRLFYQSYEDGSGRSYLWEYSIEMIISKPILGYGWGEIDIGNHNTFLNIILETGFIGIVIFVLPLFYLLVIGFKNKNFLMVSILLCGLFPALFIEAINKRFFWNGILLSILIYNTYYKNKRYSNVE